MGKPYRVCRFCGAHLDAGEICECRIGGDRMTEDEKTLLKSISEAADIMPKEKQEYLIGYANGVRDLAAAWGFEAQSNA